MATNKYESSLSSRYASDEMLYLFSADKKFTTWHRLWVALARGEMELGLPVSEEQVKELETHAEEVDYEAAARWEKKLRHDVMAHIHAYGEQCPKAMPIIHLGATSCYVGDNTDMILMREGLVLLRDKLVKILAYLGEHKQPGQFLCGFSMETENLIENSRKKLLKKNLDIVAANSLRQEGAGFGVSTNVLTLITREGETELPLLTKDEAAHKLLDRIAGLRGEPS